VGVEGRQPVLLQRKIQVSLQHWQACDCFRRLHSLMPKWQQSRSNCRGVSGWPPLHCLQQHRAPVHLPVQCSKRETCPSAVVVLSAVCMGVCKQQDVGVNPSPLRRLVHYRWYYDPKSEWYYGGEPVAWTQKPGLPSAALFGAAPHDGGPVAQPAAAGSAAPGSSSAAAAAGGKASAQEAAAATAAATGQKVVVRKTVMQLPSHPQSAIGGHQMPTSGRIGGAKGVGASTPDEAQADVAKVREG